MSKRIEIGKFFTITVSSIYGLKFYRLSNTSLKKTLAVIASIFLTLVISIYINIQLSGSNNKLHTKKQAVTQQHKKLTKTHRSLTNDYKKLNNEFFQSKIEIDYLKHLLDLEKKQLLEFDNKLGYFENKIKLRVPLKKYSPENTNLRLQNINQSIEERKIALSIIPSGSPLKVALSISSDFGSRIHPIKKIRHIHKGVDYLIDLNTPIHATANGIVKFAGHQNGYGKTIIINHDFGFRTLFAHLNTINVKKNDFIKKGQVIALSGNTGASTGPHLHYGIKFQKNFLNPRDFVGWNLYNYGLIFKKKNSKIPWKSLRYSIQNRIKQYCRLYSPLVVTSEETSE